MGFLETNIWVFWHRWTCPDLPLISRNFFENPALLTLDSARRLVLFTFDSNKIRATEDSGHEGSAPFRALKFGVLGSQATHLDPQMVENREWAPVGFSSIERMSAYLYGVLQAIFVPVLTNLTLNHLKVGCREGPSTTAP